MNKFDDIKTAILGKSYDLSIAFVTPAISKNLNKKFRGKNKPTNILSFPLSSKSGELILCKDVIRKDAPLFNLNYSKFLSYLVIHGLLHLKGMQHGSKMEIAEKKFCKKFGII